MAKPLKGILVRKNETFQGLDEMRPKSQKVLTKNPRRDLKAKKSHEDYQEKTQVNQNETQSHVVSYCLDLDHKDSVFGLFTLI